MITHLFHILKFKSLRKKIKKNPSLGKLDTDVAYLYREGLYAVKYRIVKDTSGKENVEWISQKRHLNSFEERIRRISKNFFKFWHYQRWFIFLRPPFIVILIASAFIFYFGIVQTRNNRIARLKSTIALVTGTSLEQIEYIGDGWLEINSQRKTAVDKEYEPLKYRFNIFSWLFSPEKGFISRWRGEPYGYVTHPIAYNEAGDIWIYKQGSWRSGRVSGNTVNWDTPQGTGSRSGKVSGQDIVIENGKLKIKDK